MSEFAPSAAVASSDAELAGQGDELAFARLVARYHADMAKVAYVITGDRPLAEDAVQSAWIHAWQGLRSVRDPLRIRGWLLSIAVNEARQIVDGGADTRSSRSTPSPRPRRQRTPV